MLAIAGGKGGCGKTTTTLGLAAALDGPVAAVDADFDMPNLHALAGVPRDAPDRPRGHPHPDVPDVTVYPPPTGADGPAAGVDHLRRVCEDATAATVLVDCPAGAGPDAAAPLRASDGVVLVTPACGPALRDTVKTESMAAALGTPVRGVVLSRCRLVPPGVESLFDCPVLGVVPPVDPPVLGATPVRRAHRELAAELQASKEL